MWSLSNAFTSALNKLDPIPQFKATASARLVGTIEITADQNFGKPGEGQLRC